MRTILVAVVAVLTLASVSTTARAQAGDTPAQRYLIEGQVKSGGYYAWITGITVERAIARAGGLTDRGSTRGIMARRRVNGQMQDVPLEMQDAVRPDDVIIVPVRSSDR